LIAVALVALLAAMPAAGAAAKPKKKKAPVAFCTNPADNYRAPLEALQKMPAVPEGGALRFAPGMTVSPTGPQGVIVGGSSVGFRLSNTSPEGTAAPRLNWTVLERLIRLTKNGSRVHPAGLKRINLKQLPAGGYRGLTFPLPAEPAIYSLEITIQNHRGRLLGRYGEYLRVVDRVVNVGIALAAYDGIAPGSYLESCFENHGSASVTPAWTNLERFDGANWHPVFTGPRYAPEQTGAQRILGPGESEKFGTLVPAGALPGLYKLTATGMTELGEPIALSAEFGVL